MGHSTSRRRRLSGTVGPQERKPMCQFCENIVSDLWRKLQIGQQFRTPDLHKGKDFIIESKRDDQIKITPQNIGISRQAFSAVIHYLRQNNHYMNSPCEIRASNNLKLAGPLCRAAREVNNNIRCITYILPILQKNVIAGVNPVRPNATWLLVE